MSASLVERYRRRLCALTAKHALLNAQVAALAGFQSVDHFRAWKVGASSGPIPLQRIFLLVGVLDRLDAAFREAAQGTAWLHRPNGKFENLSPVDFMLSGDSSALGKVAVYLAPDSSNCDGELLEIAQFSATG